MNEKQIAGDVILSHMPATLDWLEGLGVRARNSRYSRYINHIDAFFNTEDPQSEEGRRKFDAHTQAYRECVDIDIVRRAFSGVTDDNFVDKLKKVVSGQDVPELKDAGGSRNFLFELLVAVRFASVGYEIDHSSTTDIVARRDNLLVYSECKRLSSEKQLEANIKDAGKQLIAATKDMAERPFGLIFIDITSCVAPESYREFGDTIGIKREITRLLNEFLNKHEFLIERLNERFIDASLATCLIIQLPMWTSDGVLHTSATTAVRAAGKLPDDKYERLGHIVRDFDTAFLKYFG